MPESKVRKDAAAKRKVKNTHELADKRRATRTKGLPANRNWVPWVFVPVGLLGVAWLVVFYIAGNQIPGMRELGNYNILIGMGLLASAFGLSTLWV